VLDAVTEYCNRLGSELPLNTTVLVHCAGLL
jgi:hypothetical protein